MHDYCDFCYMTALISELTKALEDVTLVLVRFDFNARNKVEENVRKSCKVMVRSHTLFHIYKLACCKHAHSSAEACA